MYIYNSIEKPKVFRYEVDDIDEEGKERHTLSRRRIIPLPQWKANPETDPEALFHKEQLVLALYPQTTCFYRALIHAPPQRPQDDYSVLFEDTSYADGYSPPLNVAQRYVVACKENKKK
ncbi:SAGA-associated factor 29-like [Polyodon spathula]|uniref:SAGA-associated factor 29-like n=1 Tax=Polyodon spathula TaxID=7913 RepID=UPI001B7E1FA6|nr:SAGA-associated factor 29-like [Polyodon spathula]